MNEGLEKLEEILKKIKLILEHNKKISKELESTKVKLADTENRLNTLLKQKEELEYKLKTIKLAKGVHLSEDDRKGLKKQLKFYIKEIDKCLASVNN